jgi:transposase
VAALAVTARAVLSDAQWAVLAPLLPSGKKPGRPPVWTKRQLINGIRWRVRAGAPWRDMPPDYGPFYVESEDWLSSLVGSSGP